MLSIRVELTVQHHKLLQLMQMRGGTQYTVFICCVNCAEEIKIKLVQIRSGTQYNILLLQAIASSPALDSSQVHAEVW